MPTQGGTIQGSEHCPAVARYVLLRLRNGLFEVFDQTGPGGRQPFEMPPGMLEVAQRVADGFDFFQTAETCAEEVPRGEPCVPPLPFALRSLGPCRQPREEQRAHGERKRGMKDPPNGPQVPPPGRVKDQLVAVTVIQDMLPQEQIQVMMTVFMDQIVDEVEVVTVEAVDE